MKGPSDDELGRLVRRLLEALSRLSWPADRQKSYLIELGVAPSLDELALEFDDALKPVEGLYDDLGVDEESREMLASIDATFAAMTEHSEDAYVWEVQALDNNPCWAKIRGIAESVGTRLQGIFAR